MVFKLDLPFGILWKKPSVSILVMFVAFAGILESTLVNTSNDPRLNSDIAEVAPNITTQFPNVRDLHDMASGKKADQLNELNRKIAMLSAFNAISTFETRGQSQVTQVVYIEIFKPLNQVMESESQVPPIRDVVLSKRCAVFTNSSLYDGIFLAGSYQCLPKAPRGLYRPSPDIAL